MAKLRSINVLTVSVVELVHGHLHEGHLDSDSCSGQAGGEKGGELQKVSKCEDDAGGYMAGRARRKKEDFCNSLSVLTTPMVGKNNVACKRTFILTI
jgi:hypothetical protein